MPKKFSGTPGKQIRRDVRLAIYIRDRLTCKICYASLIEAKPEQIALVPLDRNGANEPCNLYTVCKSCASKYHRQPHDIALQKFREIQQVIGEEVDLGLANKILDGQSLKWPNPWSPGYVAEKLPLLRPNADKTVKRLMDVMEEKKQK